jgi:phospholipase/carboxylesterase
VKKTTALLALAGSLVILRARRSRRPLSMPVFHEVVVGGARAGERLPLVLAFHGRTSSPESIVDALDLKSLTTPVRVVALQGFNGSRGSYTWFPTRARDDVDRFAHDLASSTDRVARGVKKILRRFPTVGKPLVTGFSQGGHIALGLAARHPSLVGLSLPIAGWIPPSLIPSDGADLPTVEWQHGTQDSTVPYAFAKDSVETMQARGWHAQLLTSGVGHTITKKQITIVHDAIADAIAT